MLHRALLCIPASFPPKYGMLFLYLLRQTENTAQEQPQEKRSNLTREMSNAVDPRFWWNQTVVQGLIASPNFHHRPVKIIIFALFIVG